MEASKQQITELILDTLNGVIDTLPDSQKFVPNAETRLFGDGSLIDSLTLVSFIVDLESLFSSEYDAEIVLTDDRAMTREISPFDNVQNLSDYVFELLEEQKVA
jgi:acyl carrier protein